MANFSLRGCVIPMRTTGYKRRACGAHSYQKDPKLVKKWLSYGHFLPEILRDSIENHVGQKRII